MWQAASASSSVSGWYFDGYSGARQAVSILHTPGEIRFITESGLEQSWPAHSWRTSIDPSFRNVRIERIPYSGESLIVEDETFARSMASGSPVSSAIQRHEFFILVTLTVLAFSVGAAIWFGYPYVSNRVALALPASAEERLGNAVASAFAPDSDRLAGQEIDGPIQQLVNRLTMAHPSAYHWHVVITKDETVNALAAPGGHIAIHKGLVCTMESPDQLAAVLGHEMTHVLDRHSTRNLVRLLGVRIAVALFFGGGDQLIDGAAMLGALHYMRADEEAADQGALRLLLSSNIDPLALPLAFEQLQKQAPDAPESLKYLSTHPPLGKRRSAAWEAVKRAGQTSARTLALDDEAWLRLRHACGCMGNMPKRSKTSK